MSTYFDDVILNSYGLMSDDEYKVLYELALEVEGWIVEIGAHYGKSASILCSGFMAGKKGHVVSIDNDISPKRLTAFNANIRQFQIADYVIPILSTSKQAYALVQNLPIELLFIDGGHDYRTVYDDIFAYSPLLVKDSYIALHDYGSMSFGVDTAVRELIIDSGNYTDIEVQGRLLTCKKII